MGTRKEKEKSKTGVYGPYYMKGGNKNNKNPLDRLSAAGIEVGGAMLMLRSGEQVDLTVENHLKKHTFRHQVERHDGSQWINRHGCDANAFFIRILDECFPGSSRQFTMTIRYAASLISDGCMIHSALAYVLCIVRAFTGYRRSPR